MVLRRKWNLKAEVEDEVPVDLVGAGSNGKKLADIGPGFGQPRPRAEQWCRASHEGSEVCGEVEYLGMCVVYYVGSRWKIQTLDVLHASNTGLSVSVTSASVSVCLTSCLFDFYSARYALNNMQPRNRTH